MKTRNKSPRGIVSLNSKMRQSLIKRLKHLMDYLVVIENSKYQESQKIKIN